LEAESEKGPQDISKNVVSSTVLKIENTPRTIKEKLISGVPPSLLEKVSWV
jgi:hypothetical protein